MMNISKVRPSSRPLLADAWLPLHSFSPLDRFWDSSDLRIDLH